MVDDYRDSPTEKTVFANDGRSGKKEIDLFPALQDRRMMNHATVRQGAPSRIGSQISMFTPVSFEEALDIVECLRSRAATTISLENMKKLDASRLVDFVAGASAAIDGDFHKLSEQVYFFAPSNIRISPPVKPVPQASNTYTDLAFASAPSTEALNNLGLGALDFLYPNKSQQDTIPPVSTGNWTNS